MKARYINSLNRGENEIYIADIPTTNLEAPGKAAMRVTASSVESFSKDTTPRKLEELLRMGYRTKLLNPKWADAMATQGSSGAYEISQRMTALIGWSGTTKFHDNWVYDQAADTYALDAEMFRERHMLSVLRLGHFQNLTNSLNQGLLISSWDGNDS
jgi:magnesium chelatase subunit H